MTRWQKELPTLPTKARERLKKYAGSSLGDIAKARLGMFLPRHSPDRLIFWDALDSAVFSSALKHHPDIRVFNSRVGPFSTKSAGEPGYIGMPKDPVKWAASTGLFTGFRQRLVAGAFRRNSIEHEFAELRLFRERSRRNEHGRKMRATKSLRGASADHNGIQPLIAELNASGRSEQTIRLLIKDWSSVEVQDRLFRLMKQWGWTPVTGLPNFGRHAAGLQKRAEALFAEHFKKLIDTQIKRAERKYRGRALKRKKEELLSGASQVAGGQGLRKKYLG